MNPKEKLVIQPAIVAILFIIIFVALIIFTNKSNNIEKMINKKYSCSETDKQDCENNGYKQLVAEQHSAYNTVTWLFESMGVISLILIINECFIKYYEHLYLI